MASPTKTVIRSPLKETDSNLRQPSLSNNQLTMTNSLAKRTHDKLESKDQASTDCIKKRPRVERGRSIEGAVLVSKTAALKNVEAKLSPKDLSDWQNNWRKILRRDSKIYFDTTEEIDDLRHNKRTIDKKRDLLKRGFLSLNAEITQFFDTSVTIVITARSTDNIHYYPEHDVLFRAKQNYMKVWNFEKATRFLTNLDVDLNNIMKNKTPTIATPTLSNLLQNEKLYGPTDRDPRTKRDDIHYFKYPHVYMYDLWQTWSPIIILEWKPQELIDLNNLPYPSLKIGSFGRCPFIGDRNCDELSYSRVIKRYRRDKVNKKYALKLRQLYLYGARPQFIDDSQYFIIPHRSMDSKKMYEKWQNTNKPVNVSTSNEHSAIQELQQNEQQTLSPKEPAQQKPKLHSYQLDNNVSNTGAVSGTSLVREQSNDQLTPSLVTNTSQSLKGQVWKEPLTPKLKHPPLASFNRQETEDFLDDLCSTKKPSRVPFEIKASGVHQSNDVATSFGNGLGPTKASVMSKNIRTLNRLVVDRKLGTSNNKRVTNSNPNTSKTKSEQIKTVHGKNEKKNNTSLNTHSIESTKSNQSINIEKVKAPVTVAQEVKNSGYCENCRVKYESLNEHILSDKHMSFASNDTNFDAIDCLIEKLNFQF